MKKFCTTCGVKLEQRAGIGFNAETGKRNLEMYCPTGNCYHAGNNHDFKLTKGSFWCGAVEVCTKCGAVNREGMMY